MISFKRTYCYNRRIFPGLSSKSTVSVAFCDFCFHFCIICALSYKYTGTYLRYALNVQQRAELFDLWVHSVHKHDNVGHDDASVPEQRAHLSVSARGGGLVLRGENVRTFSGPRLCPIKLCATAKLQLKEETYIFRCFSRPIPTQHKCMLHFPF